MGLSTTIFFYCNYCDTRFSSMGLSTTIFSFTLIAVILALAMIAMEDMNPLTMQIECISKLPAMWLCIYDRLLPEVSAERYHEASCHEGES